MQKDMQRMKTILTIAAVTALLLAIPLGSVVADKTSSNNFAELVWGDGSLWAMVAPPACLHCPVHPGNPSAQEIFYEEAPQCPTSTGPGCPDAGSPYSAQSDHCDHLGITPGTNSTQCFHDHTLAVTPGTHGGFGALWRVYLVLCLGNNPSVTVGSSSCTAETVTGIPLGGSSPVTLNLAGAVVIGGTLTPLTSGSAVQAAASAGLVTIVDTGVTFICPVQQYWG